MEVIDIGLNDLEPLHMNDSGSKSVNFGTGIELLMNDKARSSNNIKMDIGDLNELNDLENELNELSGNNNNETKTLGGFASNLFGLGGGNDKKNTFTADPNDPNDSNLGNATVESIGTSKTWDGFSKMNEIPGGGDRSASSARMNDRDKKRKKRMMIKKLEEWYDKGLIKNSSHFNADSPYEDVEDEYETAMEDKRKKDGIKLQGWWFLTFVNSVEYANAAFNPFDLDLSGISENVQEDIDSYEDIFSELHDKYKGGKIAPELSLLLRLGFSAAVCNFTNKALSTATPGFNDVIRQSPELMRAFTSATVNTMSQSSPGFAMANNLMQDTKPRGPPPAAPVETRTQAPPQRTGNMVFTERPDIQAARGAMFQEQGVPVNNNFQNVNQPERSLRPPQQQPQSQQQQRPEMQGPRTDIDDILSGLKTRTINIQDQHRTEEDDSMISINSLKEMQNGNMPKRSKRRQRSDKNVISLDI
jgi:hypothetical protein